MNQHHSMKLNYTSLLRTLLIQNFTTNINAKEIYWFNLPFSRNVFTKFDKYFLNPLDMHMQTTASTRSLTETTSKSAIVAPKA